MPVDSDNKYNYKILFKCPLLSYNQGMKKLLIVIDYQVDFVSGSLGSKRTEAIYLNVLNKVNEFIANGDNIIFTKDTHYENYMSTLEGKYLPVPHCILGTEGHKLFGKLDEIAKNYPVIEKETFPGIKLVDFLREKDEEFSEIQICGILTDICVISNAILVKSIYPNTPIKIIKNCCATTNDKIENETYDVMTSLQFELI